MYWLKRTLFRCWLVPVGGVTRWVLGLGLVVTLAACGMQSPAVPADEEAPPLELQGNTINYLEAGTHRIYSFVRGRDGHLHVNYWDGFRWRWANQGQPSGTTVTVTEGATTFYDFTAQAQKLYASVKGANNRIYANYWDGARWQWQDLGTPPNTTTYGSAEVINFYGQQIYAFYRGNNGRLYASHWTGAQWRWLDQGVPQGTTVARVLGSITYNDSGDQRIYTFVTGYDGALHVNYRSGGQWRWANQGIR